MDATEGLVRGEKVTDTGGPIMVPVGTETLGRILNVVGEPVDEKGPVKTKAKRAIHQPAPEFAEQATESEILITGIKVVDLLAPYTNARKHRHTGVYFRNVINQFHNQNCFTDTRTTEEANFSAFGVRS